MQMTGYTKLFGSIVASTIWREPHTVRIVWITMLAMKNKNGIVEASLPGLADLARVTIDECKAAVAALESPDPYSRTPDHEGRRIDKTDGGWLVFNHEKYRKKMGQDERREYLRVKQQESRDKRKSSTPRQQSSTGVNIRIGKSTESTHANTQSNANSEEKEDSVPPAPAAAPLVKGGIREGKQSDRVPTTPQSKRFAAIVHRKETTPWQKSEIEAYQKLGMVPEEDLNDLEHYYSVNWPPTRDKNILRHDLLALLNHFAGEVDRAHAFKLQGRGRSIRENIVPNIIRSK